MHTSIWTSTVPRFESAALNASRRTRVMRSMSSTRARNSATCVKSPSKSTWIACSEYDAYDLGSLGFSEHLVMPACCLSASRDPRNCGRSCRSS
jgi:hypothetical protein